MIYVFKAKTTRKVVIDANNFEQAQRFYMRDYVYGNKVK